MPVNSENMPMAIADDASLTSSVFEDERSGALSGFASEGSVKRRRSSVGLEVTLARPETTAVRILRVFVLLVMVGAALAVSLSVFFYMKWEEENALDDDFQDLSRRLMDGFHANTKLRVQTMDAFGLSLTSSAIQTNQTFPFVTFSDFEARATANRVICNSEYIGLYPYVNAENRQAWEEYTTQLENLAWLDESMAYQEAFKKEHGRTVGARAPQRTLQASAAFFADNGQDRWMQEEAGDQDGLGTNEVNATFDGPLGISPVLFTYGSDDSEFLFIVDDTEDHYYPMWQVSPMRDGTILDINYNNNDPNAPESFSGAAEASRTTKTAVFAGMWNVDDDGFVIEDDDYDFRTHPAATLYYPVFDKIIGDDKEVVAVIDLDVEFGPLFSSVLPENSNHMVVVVESTCSQVHSYEVAGEEVIYLGPEDVHDRNFDHMVLQTLLTDFETTTSGTEYNGADMNKDFCPWVLSIYATQDMEDAHITNRPIAFMMAVLGIFLFTCLVFILYDRIVERRQSKVKAAAVNSDKIVSNLFPKGFKEKLYDNNLEDESRKLNAGTDPKESFQSDQVSKFFTEDGKIQPLNQEISSSPPMAEAYPHCSVFFADIAGFTAWSSTRTPTEVFTLLETIYGAFDKLAHKHSVFKIETIGDCYVAVTGLPKEQPRHAFIMVRFARDCLIKMNKLTRQLQGILGDDTANLAMRVGIHSGAVTAGILRGEKARFQLFGDTVNTAARMESNGKRDCIHVSQSAADELTAIGKGNWVHKREDLVAAKGKGMMQTYWVQPGGGTASVASTAFTGVSDGEDEDGAVEQAIASLRASAMQRNVTRPPGRIHTDIGWVDGEVEV